MMPQEDIKNRINKMIEIVVRAQTSLLDIEYIFDSLKSKSNTKEYDQFFSRLWTALWYHAIIQTNKLFESDGYFSFEKLYNLISNNYRNLNWINKPTLAELNKKFDNVIKDTEAEFTIKLIKKIRDEHFAHSDLNPPDYGMKSAELRYLLDKSGALIGFICHSLFNDQQLFHILKEELQHSLFEQLFGDTRTAHS